jgi:hypothetical protein
VRSEEGVATTLGRPVATQRSARSQWERHGIHQRMPSIGTLVPLRFWVLRPACSQLPNVSHDILYI